MRFVLLAALAALWTPVQAQQSPPRDARTAAEQALREALEPQRRQDDIRQRQMICEGEQGGSVRDWPRFHACMARLAR